MFHVLLLLPLLLWFTQVQAQRPISLSLAEALVLAERDAPLLSAQRAVVEAAEALAQSASELPDPKLTVGIDNLPVDGPDRFSIARDFMTMRRIGVMQEFPRAEKRKLRGERALTEVQREAATFELTRVNLRRDVALTWLERHFAERQRDLLRELSRENLLLIETVDAQLAGGKANAADPFIARGMRSQLDIRIAENEQQIAKAQAALKRWIGTASDRPLSAPPSFSALAYSEAHLLSELANHPHLAIYAPMEAIAEADIALAQAAKRPDWNIEVAYAQRGSSFSNMISVQARIDLPWWPEKRQEPLIAAKYKTLQQVRAQREDAQRQHEAEIRQLLIEWKNTKTRLERYEQELLPLAAERSTASFAAYQGGRGDLIAVIEARKNEIELRAARLQLEAQLARAWAQLNYLLPNGASK